MSIVRREGISVVTRPVHLLDFLFVHSRKCSKGFDLFFKERSDYENGNTLVVRIPHVSDIESLTPAHKIKTPFGVINFVRRAGAGSTLLCGVGKKKSRPPNGFPMWLTAGDV